jgi:hypothetical protein
VLGYYQPKRRQRATTLCCMGALTQDRRPVHPVQQDHKGQRDHKGQSDHKDQSDPKDRKDRREFLD